METAPGQSDTPDPIAGSKAAARPEATPASAEPRNPSGISLWIRDLLVSAFASVLIITFLYQPVRVEGISMLPRLENRDRLFINKFAYHFSAIERGDIIVFRYPRDPSTSYIKRVIALPSDSIRIDRGRVVLNGKVLPEPYVPQQYRDDRSMSEMIVPANSYFVLGDHRNVASDSREFGPVDRSLVYGKAVFVYWPAHDLGVVR
jgi:signal peptidase I